MEITVKLNKLRTSPRKVRPVLHIVKGMSAVKALEILQFTNKGISKDLYKLVKSGIASALEHEMEEDQLIIKYIKCDQAQSMKRHIFKARGRVARIRKRSSHVTVVISDSKIEKLEDKKEDHKNDSIDKVNVNNKLKKKTENN